MRARYTVTRSKLRSAIQSDVVWNELRNRAQTEIARRRVDRREELFAALALLPLGRERRKEALMPQSTVERLTSNEPSALARGRRPRWATPSPASGGSVGVRGLTPAQ